MNGQSRSCWDPTQYLTDLDIETIHARLENLAPSSRDRLLFWNGMPREHAQRWADDHGMFTLSSAMGPLMDSAYSSCPKWQKTKKQWKRYIKGASGLFAEYACTTGTVTVLMRPPEQQSTPRRDSTYWGIERPILFGEKGLRSGTKLVTIYPTEVLKGSKPRRNIDNSISTRNPCRVISKASNEIAKDFSTEPSKKVDSKVKKSQRKNNREVKKTEKQKRKAKKEKKKARRERRKAKKRSVDDNQKLEKIDPGDRQGSLDDRTRLNQICKKPTHSGELMYSTAMSLLLFVISF